MTHDPQPSGLSCGLNFLIDSEWTPEQAYAVFQLLDDLRDRILAKYQLAIMEQMREEHGGEVEPLPFDNPYLWISDEIPF
ncbi:MAG: hypothetical protein HOP23_10320 [Methylococcaceae bacterium]|nr:hypothetical protein [Methylococcaceae bacterium]